MSINKNPKCTDVNCEGGVITTDGQVGIICKFCNPPVEIPTPLQLLVAKKEALMTEPLTADTKQRNRIKKAVPAYNDAISLLNHGQPKIV
jgi:hypothetical protein